MAIADDSKSSQELPSLPELPGMVGLGASDAPSRTTSTEPLSDVFSHGADALEAREHRPSPAGELLSGLTPGGEPIAPSERSEPAVRAERPDRAERGDRDGAGGVDPYLGKMFGGYELVAKIGQGGMGLVYKGRQVSLDRVVAVKILNQALCDNAEFIKRFEREAKSIARINHPNIMSVYDFGQTGGVYYMVIEFIEGSSLSRQIADRLMIPVADLAPLLVQCLAGLAHVGVSGIVHRDIKPDNILITRDHVAKIADFGLAKDVTNNDQTDLTTVGLAMGTPAYMSPEQCMGRRLDGRSDIYSLGVTAYLALTGEKPFTGQSSFEIMTKQRELVPPPPIQLNPNIPKPVSDLVMRMLAKNPQERFTDAEACRQAWLDVMQQLHAPPLPPVEAERKSTRAPSVPPVSNLAVDPVPGHGAAARLGGEARPGPGEAPKTPPRKSGEFAVPGPSEPEAGGRIGSDRQQRPSTEKRIGRSASGETSTCGRCGMLYRLGLATCSRCGNDLRETPPDPAIAKELAREQELEAQRLFQTQNYHEAAQLYARLADREADRRQRTILRSKEREARTLEHQHQVEMLRSRTSELLERGQLRAGLEVLEQGLREVRDAGSSSTGAETRLMQDISALRSRLRRQRQRTLLLSLAAAVALAVAVGLGLHLLVAGHAAARPAAPASAPMAQPGAP
jgi:serine/threonine protein kinase